MQYYTQKALDALDRKIVEAGEALKEANLSMGSGADADSNTWHDNPAFEQAKMEVDQARTQLQKFKELRADAVLVGGNDGGDTLDVGGTAVIQIEGQEPMTVHLAGHQVLERDRSNPVYDLATSSPLGSVLVGSKVGETKKYSLPSGASTTVSVLKIV